jgi:hypothetical protein
LIFYAKDESYDSWQDLLKSIISLHINVLKPGGFLVINIADIFIVFYGNNIRGGRYTTGTHVKLVRSNLEKYVYNAGLYLYDK